MLGPSMRKPEAGTYVTSSEPTRCSDRPIASIKIFQVGFCRRYRSWRALPRELVRSPRICARGGQGSQKVRRGTLQCFTALLVQFRFHLKLVPTSYWQKPQCAMNAPQHNRSGTLKQLFIRFPSALVAQMNKGKIFCTENIFIVLYSSSLLSKYCSCHS